MSATKKDLARNILLTALAISILVWTFSYVAAQETACPTASPCKVLVLTEEQVATLDQLVSNTAIQGPYAQIHQLVQFYKDLLAKAPAGKVAPETKK